MALQYTADGQCMEEDAWFILVSERCYTVGIESYPVTWVKFGSVTRSVTPR